MVLSSSSSIASMLPCSTSLLELTTDGKLLYAAVFNIIGNVEKPNGLQPPLTSLVVNYLEVLKEERHRSVFGEREWAEHFGTVPAAPELPLGIEEIWQGPCPIHSGRKVSETHMFVYIPKTVNGQSLTLRSLGILAKKYFPKNSNGYRYILNPIFNQIGNLSIDNSYWVLMTNKGIPGSGGKFYNEQRNIVTALSKTILPAYEVPRALEAAVCILTRYASSRICLFRDNYTRCQENVEEQVVVGGFSHVGLRFNTSNSDGGAVVVAGMRRFFRTVPETL